MSEADLTILATLGGMLALIGVLVGGLWTLNRLAGHRPQMLPASAAVHAATGGRGWLPAEDWLSAGERRVAAAVAADDRDLAYLATLERVIGASLDALLEHALVTLRLGDETCEMVRCSALGVS